MKCDDVSSRFKQWKIGCCISDVYWYILSVWDGSLLDPGGILGNLKEPEPFTAQQTASEMQPTKVGHAKSLVMVDVEPQTRGRPKNSLVYSRKFTNNYYSNKDGRQLERP